MTRDEVLSALRAGAEREFAAVPAEGELTWEPSPGFRTRMEALVRQERRFLWRRTSTSLRRAALVAALLLLLLATLITAGAFQEPVFRMFVRETSDYLIVSYGVNTPGDTEVTYGPCEPYTFAWLPEGFEETSFTILDDFGGYDGAFCETVWTNAEGETITLYQGPASGCVYLPIGSGEYQTITVGEIDALIQNGRDYLLPYAPFYTHVYWASDQYAFSLCTQTHLTPDTILEILCSLERRESLF